MHRASLGLRFMTIYDQGQRVKCPGTESSEVKKLMYMPKKVQGMGTPNMAELLTGVAWRTKDIDTIMLSPASCHTRIFHTVCVQI